MKDYERNKILNIITHHCASCPNVMKCPERKCILFRIESTIDKFPIEKITMDKK